MLAAGFDAAPAARTDHPQLDSEPRRSVDRPRDVLARLERADREHVVAIRTRPLGRERRVDGVRDDADLLGRDPEHCFELGGCELGDREYAPCRPQDARYDTATVFARPARECRRVAEYRDVVNRDDERRARVHRPAVRRAMEDVRAACPQGQDVGIPRKVEPERARGSAREALHAVDLHVALHSRKQRLQIAGGSSTRLREWRHVDGDLHRTASHAARCAPPLAAQVNGAA